MGWVLSSWHEVTGVDSGQLTSRSDVTVGISGWWDSMGWVLSSWHEVTGVDSGVAG